MNKAVIFDIDGTLLDTTLGIRSSVDYVTNKYNLTKLNDCEFKDFISYSPITASFSNVCKTDAQMSQECGNEFISIYKQRFLHLAQPFDGIMDLLNYLIDNNYKLGVATYKNEQNAKLMLSKLNLDKYFDEICGSTEDKKKKKKEILSDCIKQLDIKYNDCIFIGDSKTDAVASSDLFVPFIGVTYGFGFKVKNDVNVYPNILCAETPQEILNYFRS